MSNDAASPRGSPRRLIGSPVPVRRERQDDEFQQSTADKENSKTLLEAPPNSNQEASNASNAFYANFKASIDKKKKPKKKKVEDSDDDEQDDGPSFGYKKPPLRNAKDAAEEDFKKETAEIQEQQTQYQNHLANLRTKYLDDSSSFMRSETPRITELIGNEDFGGLIEDSGQLSNIQDRARKHAEALTIKYRSARGSMHMRKDCEMNQKSLEKSISRIGKQMLQLLAATGDLLMMATEQGDCQARITYMTQVHPQWSVFYDMLIDRADQWIFYSYVIKMLDSNIKIFKEQQTKSKIKHELDALDMAESDLDTSSSSSSDDDDDDEDDEESDESSSEDGDSDAAVDGDEE